MEFNCLYTLHCSFMLYVMGHFDSRALRLLSSLHGGNTDDTAYNYIQSINQSINQSIISLIRVDVM